MWDLHSQRPRLRAAIVGSQDVCNSFPFVLYLNVHCIASDTQLYTEHKELIERKPFGNPRESRGSLPPPS